MKVNNSSAIAILLALGFALGSATASYAQGTDAAKAPGPLPRKDAAKKGAAPKAPPPGMEVRPAPTTGSMPGKHAPAPKGRLGTEPAQKGKLGTPPPENSKDRPPRPQ
jgi:hypothetical protein